MDKLIELAKCTKPHGIKGGFLLHLHNSDSSTIQKGKKVIVKSEKLGGESEFVVASIQYGNKTICYFEGVTDRSAIESLLPFTVCLKRSELEELDDDEFYLSDLVGMKVFDQSENEIGKIKSFYDNGAQPVAQIQTKNGVLELPFVDAFFKEIDMDNFRVDIFNPEVIE